MVSEKESDTGVIFRDADDLYGRLSVNQVYLVYENTRTKVESKQEEVRQLISERYHDLIDSADAIVGMDRSVSEFTNLANDIQKLSDALVSSGNRLCDTTLTGDQLAFSIEENTQDSSPVQTNEQNHNMSDEVLLVKANLITHAAVDIWESTDAKKLWESCELYLSVKKLYEELLQTDICARYPYLRSHWSLIREAKDRIVSEAKTLLADRNSEVEVVRGCIRTLVTLKHNSNAECIEMMLRARTHVIESMWNVQCDEGDDDTNLEKTFTSSVVTIRQTVADVASLILQEDSDDNAELSRMITEWVRKQSAVVYAVAVPMLENVDSIVALTKLEKELLDIQKNGDLESSLDAATWKKSYESCLERDLWSGKEQTFLFELLFRDGFAERGTNLLLTSFEAISTNIVQVLKDIVTSPGLMADPLGQDTDDLDFNKPYMHKLAQSHDPLKRACTAVLFRIHVDNMFAIFRQEIFSTPEEQRELLMKVLRERCFQAFKSVIHWLREAIEKDSLDANSDGTNALFLARVAEVLQHSEFLLELFGNQGMIKLHQEMLELCDSAYQVWSRGASHASWHLLEESLKREDWSLNRDWRLLSCGWEKISLELDGVAIDEEDEEDYTLESTKPIGESKGDVEDGDDVAILPGCISPGVASYSHAILKHIRVLGDVKFLPSVNEFAHYVQTHAEKANIEFNGASCVSVCSDAFTAANKRVIGKFCDDVFARIVETYQKHTSSKESSPNEAAALQTVFDIQWFCWLFGHSKPDNVLDKIVDANIDPVDWMVYEVHVTSRVKRFCLQNSLLFGPLLLSSGSDRDVDDDSASTTLQDSLAKSNSGNLLYLPSKTLPRIPLLPIPRSAAWKPALTIAAAPQATTLREVKQQNGTVPATATLLDEGSTALKSVGQVGSHLLSQASSWLQR